MFSHPRHLAPRKWAGPDCDLVVVCNINLRLGNTEHPELTQGRDHQVKGEAREVQCKCLRKSTNKARLLKLKLIAIMIYCFKQDLHKLLWFNDNDKDNINEMKLFSIFEN